MKTLILYASKHGATHEIAKRIACRINDSVIYSLKQNDIPSLSQFDCIIVGSPLYAGMIQKQVKKFLNQNADDLRGKKLGLFLSGLDASKENVYFDANFTQDILQAATAKSFLGGIFDPKKTGFMERFIIKIVTKQSAYTENILDDKIEQFTKSMKGGI